MKQKVKSGCRTCKTRKVKCDENWPVCSRCRSSGKFCEGYGIWGGGSGYVSSRSVSSSSYVASPEPALQLATVSSSEKDCLEWFVRRSAVKLPGVFRSEYWNALLIQASTTEPAVRHALLTLSSAHKEEVSGSAQFGQENDSFQSLFTITQYSKAIGHLQTTIENDKTISHRATLIACVLFMSAEFLRAHYAAGILHLESGLRLLCLQHRATTVDPSGLCIDGWIITQFTRQLVQAKLFGQTTYHTPLNVFPLETSIKYEVFRSKHHARRTLEHILLHIFYARDNASISERSVNTIRQIRLRTTLHAWLQVNQRTIRSLPTRTPFLETFAYKLLQLYYHAGCILVETCLDPVDELAYDLCEVYFAKIISQCREMEETMFVEKKEHRPTYADPEETSPNSITDIGWAGPLFLVATKCRNHYLRHTAVRLLHISKHKEGVWDSKLAVEVAEMIVKTEEGSFYDAPETKATQSGWKGRSVQLNSIKAKNDLMGDNIMPSLPLDHRLVDVKISLPTNRVGKLAFTASRQHSNDQIEWVSKEYDLRTNKWVTISAS